MKTLMAIITFLLGAIATVLQKSVVTLSEQGELALAKASLNAMWWVTGSCLLLGSTLLFLLFTEIRNLDR
jgi:hypothetical protein